MQEENEMVEKGKDLSESEEYMYIPLGFVKWVAGVKQGMQKEQRITSGKGDGKPGLDET